MTSVVQMRQQRAAAARVLLSLHASGNLDNPGRWTWDAVDRLPGWCLAGTDERVQLQLTCGSMYLSPDMRFWISKTALQTTQDLLGASLFDRIMSQADDMQLPRESVSAVIAQAGIDPASAQANDIQGLLMAAGANVLAATVHESLPREMLTASLGPGIGDITLDAATILLKAAEALLSESDLKQAGEQ